MKIGRNYLKKLKNSKRDEKYKKSIEQKLQEIDITPTYQNTKNCWYPSAHKKRNNERGPEYEEEKD